MRPSARRRLAAVAATAALLGVGALGGGVSHAEPTPTPPAPEDPLQVVLGDVQPRALDPRGTLQVRGTLTNTGPTEVTDIQVRLRVGERITTRGALREADLERPVTSARNRTATAPTATSLAPGARATFVIEATVPVLGLRGVGIYPLDVEARGNAGDGFHPLGLAPTWLPYFAGGRPQPTRVAVVWPLVDRPHQRLNGTFVDDELAASLAPGGRLGRSLAAAAAAAVPQCERSAPPAAPAGPGEQRPAPAPARCERVPVTYAVDPDLLQAVTAMTRPYQVASAGKGVKGSGRQVASAWLERLQAAVRQGALLALPYADPDVTAMTRLGSTFKDDFAQQASLGRATAGRALGVAPLETAAWPPAGVITPEAVEVLSRTGARALVLDESAYPQRDSEPARTPSAQTVLPSALPAPLGQELVGLVADEVLSRLLLGDPEGQGGPRAAEQRFLAETAVISFQAPSLSRTLVLAPERRGEVDQAAAAGALRDLGRVPWLCPVTLASVAAGTERCADRPEVASPTADDRGPLRTADAGELSPRYLQQVAAERDRGAQLTDAVLTDELTSRTQPGLSELKAQLRRAVARAESSSWRTDPVGAARALSTLQDDVRALTGKVVVRGGQVLLTSTSGTLQVSVENTLDVPVKVRVRFRPRTLGLDIETSAVVQVMPKQAVPVSVRATAQKAGQFVVDADLLDRDGRPFGPSSTVYVRSTRYGRLALGVTVAAAGVLLAAAGMRIVRRTRRPAAA